MKKFAGIVLVFLFSMTSISATLNDEALFNQIINSQKSRFKVNKPGQSDNNLLNVPQENTQQLPIQENNKSLLKEPKLEETDKIKIESVSKELTVYGHDLFENTSDNSGQSSSRQFIADQNVNVPDDYVLGSGDAVTLQFWGRTTKTEDLVIDRSGEIYSETLGRLTLGGQNYAQARNAVTKMVEGMEGVSGSLVISNTKTVKVLVSGNVEKPGYYILNVFGNVTQAIVDAGGVKEAADIRKVSLIRNGKTIDTVDYYSMITKGAYKPKIQKLMANDVIFVPRASKRVLVEGDVKTEAYFDLNNERTVNDVLKLAGGVNSSALTNNVILTRLNKDDMKYTVRSLDLKKGSDMAYKVEDGDKITVYKVDENAVSSIKVTGNTFYPGTYEYKTGMRITDVIKNANYLLPDTEMDYSYILRRDAATSETIVLPFSFIKIFADKASAGNLTLRPFDEIIIVNKYSVMENIEIDVLGEVVNPGSYKATKNTSVYNMIVSAGGFTSDSDKSNIEIVKLINGVFSFEKMDVNKSMSIKAPLQGYIVVHDAFETASLNFVEVSGDVLNHGEYMYHKGMNIRDILYKSISPDKRANGYSVIIYRTNKDVGGREVFNFSIKNVNDPKTSYEIESDDKIIVKDAIKDVARYVSIEGAVEEPGVYQHAENISVSRLIVMAGGVKDSAFTDSIEIVRKEIKNGEVTQNYILVKKEDEDVTMLKAGDRLVVKDIADYNKTEYITLSGEVKFPGKYPIIKGEKLSVAIERAGGFTDKAYLNGAVFSRIRVRQEKQKMLNKMITNLEREILVNANIEAMTASTMTSVDSSDLMLKTKDQFVSSMKKLKADGRIVLKLSHPRLLKGSINDIELENGDELYIPSLPSTVVVSGSVLSPGAFVYNSKMDWEDYIKLTGGLLTQADKKNIFIIKANGTAEKVNGDAVAWSPQNDRWEFSFFKNDMTLAPGDTIMIPDNYSRIPWMRNIKDITQIMMQIAVTAGVLTNL